MRIKRNDESAVDGMFFDNDLGQAYEGVRPYAFEADGRKEAKPAVHIHIRIQNIAKIAVHANTFIQRF
jgi:hypothetical protein